MQPHLPIRKLAEDLSLRFQKTRPGQKYITISNFLPFDDIDSIKCGIKIEYDHLLSHKLFLRVTFGYYSEPIVDPKSNESYTLYDIESDVLVNPVDVHDIELILTRFYNDLPNLRFNKEHTKLMQFAATEEMEMDICCVCLEKTNTMTECGHHICFVCYNKLSFKKSMQTEINADVYCIYCPMCRNETNYELFVCKNT